MGLAACVVVGTGWLRRQLLVMMVAGTTGTYGG